MLSIFKKTSDLTSIFDRVELINSRPKSHNSNCQVVAISTGCSIFDMLPCINLHNEQLMRIENQFFVSILYLSNKVILERLLHVFVLLGTYKNQCLSHQILVK